MHDTRPEPGERIELKHPQIAESSATHAAIDDELAVVVDASVGLAGRWRLSQRHWLVPGGRRGRERVEFEHIEVVKVARDVVFRVR